MGWANGRGARAAAVTGQRRHGAGWGLRESPEQCVQPRLRAPWPLLTPVRPGIRACLWDACSPLSCPLRRRLAGTALPGETEAVEGKDRELPERPGRSDFAFLTLLGLFCFLNVTPRVTDFKSFLCADRSVSSYKFLAKQG